MLRFLKRTIGRFLPYWPLAVVVLLATVVWAAFQTLFPLSIGLIIDRVIVPRDPAGLRLLLIVLPASFAIYAVAVLLADRAHVRLTAHVVNDLRLFVFRHLQRLSTEFYSRVRPGDVSSRFSTDLADIEYALTYTLNHGTAALLSMTAAVVVLFALEPALATLAVGGLALVLLGPRLLSKRAQEAGYTIKQQQGLLQDMVNENLQAQPVVKAFGLERHVINVFRLNLSGLFGFGVRAHFLAAMMERVPTLTIVAFSVAVTCAGAWLAFRGVMSIGSLVSFYAVFAMLSDAVTTVMWVLPFIVRATAAQRRIDEILDEAPSVADPDVPVPLRRFSRDISLRDVTFGYDAGSPILDNVTLDIDRGTSVAVVGPSGCGKSTLFRLLLRAYDPWTGSICLDGVDLRSARQEDLRAQLGVVLQDNFLFNTSIRENIRVVNPQATDADVEGAASAAEVHDAIVALPAGYETVVGDRGMRLSPGQRQRVALARALVRGPDILLLDEATSALDATTEAAVNRTIERLPGDRTVVSITHRLTSAMTADAIVVMDRGRVVGHGTHRTLVADNDIYRELWERQTRFAVRTGGELEADALRNIKLFEGLDDQSLQAIGLLMATEEHPAFSDVLCEGDVGEKLYLIAHGSVEIVRSGQEQAPEAILSEGDHFGEIALLDKVPRTATVRTRRPTTMLTLNRNAFRSLVAADESVRRTVEATARARRV